MKLSLLETELKNLASPKSIFSWLFLSFTTTTPHNVSSKYGKLTFQKQSSIIAAIFDQCKRNNFIYHRRCHKHNRQDSYMETVGCDAYDCLPQDDLRHYLRCLRLYGNQALLMPEPALYVCGYHFVIVDWFKVAVVTWPPAAKAYFKFNIQMYMLLSFLIFGFNWGS